MVPTRIALQQLNNCA